MKYSVEIAIAAIIIILIIFVIGYILRKKFYKEIDRLEAKKLELLNSHVMDELIKVKSLNMLGEAEERFERWRSMWDDITAVQLPNIDEKLFYAEEFIDKYRFKQAKDIQEKIEHMLIEIEGQIEIILNELAELMEYEEKNRTEMEELVEQYRNAKKNLLAHEHIYGIAANRLEKLLASLGEQVKQYETLTNDGNYMQAREVVQNISVEMEQLADKMEKIPDLLIECMTIIPSQRNELHAGYKEMVDEGYILQHLQIEKQFSRLDEALHTYVEFLKDAQVHEVEEGMKDLKDTIDSIYDLFEKEVYARHHINQENNNTENLIDLLSRTNMDLKNETNMVKHSYQLLDEEIKLPNVFEKNLDHLTKSYDLLKTKITEEVTAFSLLSKELKELESQLKELEAEQNQFIERLQSLRKDELDVREKANDLQKKIHETIRIVQKSRMPGIPTDIVSLFEQAEEQIEDVYKSLNEKPLNMKSVQKFLYDATDTVDHLFEKTEDHIQNAQFAERVIQYGNRYRGRDPQLRERLDQAEQAFRNYEYKSALEQAATAVEDVEPGALKRIEEMIEEGIVKR